MLGEDERNILFVYLHKDRYAIASPVSELGLQLMFQEFGDHDAVAFAKTEHVIPDAMA
jgi:hypothetical protein